MSIDNLTSEPLSVFVVLHQVGGTTYIFVYLNKTAALGCAARIIREHMSDVVNNCRVDNCHQHTGADSILAMLETPENFGAALRRFNEYDTDESIVIEECPINYG